MEHKPIVVVTGRIRNDALDRLKEHCEVRQWNDFKPMPRELAKEWLVDADALWAPNFDVDEDIIAHAPKLKVVAHAAVGYDRIDIDALTARGIPYGNTPNLQQESVAEFAMGLVVCASRRIVENINYIKEDKWMDGEAPIKGFELSRTTMGILGMGNIGVAISRRARAFGMTVLYHNRTRRTDDTLYMTKYVSFDELLEKSDVIVSVLPLTAETEGMLNYEAFKKMKNTALLVNVGRGKVVNSADLAKALEEGEISYAALDVVDPEPIGKDHLLLKTGKCLITPHVASYTDRTRQAMAFMTVDNILNGIAKKPLVACVNEEVNYKAAPVEEDVVPEEVLQANEEERQAFLSELEEFEKLIK